MNAERPLYIPVILGTTRMGRMSEHVAKFIAGEIGKHEEIETGILDVLRIQLPTNDAGEQIKDPSFSNEMKRADAVVIVAPEYNHGYPGYLKHVLDTNLKEYIHKAAGICGVSAGPFGGARVIENLLPVLRELGLVTIFWDVNFSGVQNAFDKDGRLLDEAYIRRAEKFIKELIWMARVLRYGRDNVEI